MTTVDVPTHTPRPRGPMTVDLALVRHALPSVVLAMLVGAFLLGSPVLTTVVYGELTWASYGQASMVQSPYALASLVVVLTAVLLGRRYPAWATLLALTPLLAYPWTHWWAYGWWLAVVAIAMLAALDGLRRAVVPVLAALAVVFWYCAAPVVASVPIGVTDSGTGVGIAWDTFAAHVVGLASVVGIAAAVGSASRSRDRSHAAAVVEQRALEVESVAAERARLARDLHDVVAHHVSLVAVRAESAPYQFPDLDPDARVVLAAIAGDARQALGELRHVLTVLRRTDADTDRAPQPGASDVDDLVTAARAAGQAVTTSGDWGEVGPAPGYVLFRVVQECLTNGRRHAPAATVDVERWRTDDGAGAGLRVANAVTGVADGDVVPGRGLHGMRERVEAVGGTLTGRVVGGRFVVEVLLPEVHA